LNRLAHEGVTMEIFFFDRIQPVTLIGIPSETMVYLLPMEKFSSQCPRSGIRKWLRTILAQTC
jgi:hypothetical protein